MSRLNSSSLLLVALLLACPVSARCAADAKPADASRVVLSAVDTADLALFERKATLAKRLGATHVPLTDGLPVAKWQYQPPDDPYPPWFIHRPDFLKRF